MSPTYITLCVLIVGVLWLAATASSKKKAAPLKLLTNTIVVAALVFGISSCTALTSLGYVPNDEHIALRDLLISGAIAIASGLILYRVRKMIIVEYGSDPDPAP